MKRWPGVGSEGRFAWRAGSDWLGSTETDWDHLWSNYEVPIDMLARFGGVTDIPCLADLTHHESAHVRVLAVWALGQIDPTEPRAHAAIEAACNDLDRRVQLQAGSVLAGLKWREHTQPAR